MTRLGLAADPEDGGAAQPEANEGPVYAPAAGEPTESAHRAHHPAAHGAGASHRHEEPKTRIYRGATYVKGEDGQWHLKETPARDVRNEAQAIPLPSATPFANAAQMNAQSRTAYSERVSAPAKKSAQKAKPAPKKAQAKAAAKRKPTKPAAKPATKATAKRPVKAAAKSASKSPAKRPLKSASKPVAKTSAQSASKTSAKPASKAPVKQPVKTAAKPQTKAPARKPAPAKKKTVIAARPKPAKKTVTPKPPINPPAPEPEIVAPPQEFIAAETVPEIVKES